MRSALALLVLLTSLGARAQFERPASPPIDRNLLRVGVLDAGAIVVPTLGAADGGFVTVTGAGLRANELSGELLRATTGSFDGGVNVGGPLTVGGAAQVDRLQVAGAAGIDGGLLVHGDVATSGTVTAPTMRTTFLDAGTVNASSLWVGFADAGAVRADLMTVGLLDAGALRAGAGSFSVLGATTLQAGAASVDFLELQTLDAGVVFAHAIRNADGGEVFVPGGLAMQAGSAVRLDGPTGSVAVLRSPGGDLLLSGGAGETVAENSFRSQGPMHVQTLSPVAVRLTGGSDAGSIALVGGTGTPSPDAGLYLEAGAPNGMVHVTHPSGLTTGQLGNRDGGDVAVGLGLSWPLSLNPGPCNSTTPRSLRNQVVFIRTDGGIETQLIGCDGEEWYTLRPRRDYTFVLGSDETPNTTILSVPPDVSTGMVTLMNWTPHTVGGTGVTEFNVMQTKPDGGLNRLCTLGPIPCNLTPGQTMQALCPSNRWFRGPSDGGTAQNIIVARDAGCVGAFGRGAGLVGTRLGICIPGSGVECE